MMHRNADLPAGGSKNNPLTLIKATVFLHAISQAGWNRFSSVYMLSHGFTPTQIGYVNSMSKISKAVAQPLWGVASDSVFDPLTAVIASTILGTATLTSVRTAIDAGSASSVTFWRVVRSAVTAASPAIDALVLKLVEGTSEGYGKQRLWGSVAWGLSSLCVGPLLDVFGEGALFLYTYFVSGVLLFFFLLLRRVLPAEGARKQRDENAEKKSRGDNPNVRVCNTVRMTLHDISGPHLRFVLLHNFGYGAIMVLFDNILMLQLERDFGMSRSVQGVFTMVSICSTLPVYHYSREIKERMGHLGMIQSSILVAFVRLLLTKVACSGAVPDDIRATLLLVIQLLHGYHFASNWTASVEMLDAMASRRRSLMQFLLNLAYFVCGAGLGNLEWSFMYEKKGAQDAYNGGIVLCLVDFLFVQLFHKRDRDTPTLSGIELP
ncbi:hypothetical protein ACHAXT_006067 [Thalassiosira profunda]